MLENENAVSLPMLSKRLDMSDAKIRDYVKNKGMPHFMNGADYKFFISEVLAFLKELEEKKLALKANK
jgi:hypothetical protein